MATANRGEGQMRVVAEGADISDRTQSDGQRVGLGSRVLIFDGYGEVEFMVVPDEAARSASGRNISAKSPLGKALLGRRVGEEIVVRTRMGINFVRIRDVL
jgi:transcription elongation factor GreA